MNDKTSADAAQPHSPQAIAALYDASGYDLDTHPAHMIRRAHQRATTCFQNAMTGYDLTPTQHAALATLLKHGELSQNHLGRITAMDRSTISIVVRKLMESGLVQSSPSSTDQRLSVLRLTPDGIEYTLPLLKLSLDSAEQFLAPLTSRERSTFVKLLGKLTDTE
jgi:DNA-binding MarR family transcriptional regulator